MLLSQIEFFERMKDKMFYKTLKREFARETPNEIAIAQALLSMLIHYLEELNSGDSHLLSQVSYGILEELDFIRAFIAGEVSLDEVQNWYGEAYPS